MTCHKIKARNAFTLIELLISISILSIMMVFLYKSYASLNISNTIYKKEVAVLNELSMKKKVIFLDFSVASFGSIKINSRNKNTDFMSMQTTNSTHRNFKPYVAYIVKKNKLYRLESLKSLPYELSEDSEFSVDEFGEVSRFRVFENKKKDSYIVDIKFKNTETILLKIKTLNER